MDNDETLQAMDVKTNATSPKVAIQFCGAPKTATTTAKNEPPKKR